MEWTSINECDFCGGTKFTRLHTNHLLFKAKISFSECTNCGLIIMNPALSEVYYQMFMDGLIGRKAFQMLFTEKTSYNGLLQNLLAHKHDAETLFDMGCGLGLLLSEAEQAGLKAAGNDVNFYSVEYAKQKGLNVQLKPSYALNENSETYDIVVMKSYLAHSPQPFTDIQTAHKMLRENGLLFIREALVSNLKDALHEEIELDHLTLLTLNALTSMLKKAGFHIIETTHFKPFRKIYSDKVDVYAKKHSLENH